MRRTILATVFASCSLAACGGGGPTAVPAPTGLSRFCDLLRVVQTETFPTLAELQRSDPSKLDEALVAAESRVADAVRAAPERIREEVDVVLRTTIELFRAQTEGKSDRDRLNALRKFEDPTFRNAQQTLQASQATECGGPAPTAS